VSDCVDLYMFGSWSQERESERERERERKEEERKREEREEKRRERERSMYHPMSSAVTCRHLGACEIERR
jgi:hypothetical protein